VAGVRLGRTGLVKVRRVLTGRVGRYVAAAVAAAVLVGVLGPGWRTGFPPVFPDSHSYLDVAARNPWSPRFWFDQRPPGYPLFVWLLGSSPAWIVVAQTVCWFVAWGWLLSTAWQLLPTRPIAVAAVVFLGLIGIETRWILWNTQILTESLSGALAVAMVAAWWRWLVEPGRFRTTVATALTVAWMLVRDSNAVTMVVAAVPVAAVAVVVSRWTGGPRYRTVAVALAAVLVAGGYSVAAQLATDRGESTFHNNMGLRWLTADEMRAWFVDRGLPMSPALESRAGKDAWADGEAFLRDPALSEYRAWADGAGRRAAAWSMVTQVGWYADRFGDEIDRHAGTDFAEYDSYHVAAQLPERPLGWLDPSGSGGAIAAWAALVGVLAIASLALRERRAVLFVGFLAWPVAVDLYLSYAGDAIEVARHLAGPLLRLSVVAVVGAAVLLDASMRGRGSDEASGA